MYLEALLSLSTAPNLSSQTLSLVQISSYWMLLNKKISLTNSIKFYFTKDLLGGIISFHKISYRKGFLRILITISSMKFLFTNLHLIRSSINIIISSIQFAGEKGILGSIMVKTG
jgi:hypothetical protein